MKLTFWNKDVGIQHYTYDHNGIRILKSSAREVGVYKGGELIGTELEMDPYTVYVNPYFVATHYTNEVEASKHYYMGTQRVASALISYLFVEEPDGGLPESGSTSYGAVQNLIDVLDYFEKDDGVHYDLTDLLDMRPMTSYYTSGYYNSAITTWCADDIRCKCELSRYFAQELDEADCDVTRVIYWYHPDYLGNTEYITDWSGNPYQYFWYSPWGESLEDQHRYQSLANPPYDYYDSPYAFNAKEFDFETGNYYYGARYYNPKYSIWLSVDPLAHEFPNQTPYNFVFNNPIMFVDPKGLAPDWWGDLKEKAKSFYYTISRVWDRSESEGMVYLKEVEVIDQHKAATTSESNEKSGFGKRAFNWGKDALRKFVSKFVLLGSSLGSSVYRGFESAWHEGFLGQKQPMQFDRKIAPYVIDENWNFKKEEDILYGLSPDEAYTLMDATISTVIMRIPTETVAPVLPKIPFVSRSKITKDAINVVQSAGLNAIKED